MKLLTYFQYLSHLKSYKNISDFSVNSHTQSTILYIRQSLKIEPLLLLLITKMAENKLDNKMWLLPVQIHSPTVVKQHSTKTRKSNQTPFQVNSATFLSYAEDPDLAMTVDMATASNSDCISAPTSTQQLPQLCDGAERILSKITLLFQSEQLAYKSGNHTKSNIFWLHTTSRLLGGNTT